MEVSKVECFAMRNCTLNDKKVMAKVIYFAGMGEGGRVVSNIDNF
jgi:hypothetical protein